MKQHLVAIMLAVTLLGCTELKVVDRNPATGEFPTNDKARVLLSKKVDLDAHKSLLLAPKWEYSEGMLRKIAYFGELMTPDDLETRIVAANLGDRVPSVRDRIGLNKAAKNYKEFLWLHIEQRGSGAEIRFQLILTDPMTMEDYFVAESDRDAVFRNFSDQHTWYPLFNALIGYIRENSRTYAR